MLRFSAILVLVALISGCAGSSKTAVQRPDRDTAAPVAGMHILNEDFDPSTLTEPESIIKPKVKKTAQRTPRKQATRTRVQQPTEIIGFRVQLLQTRDAEEARQVRNEAILDLDTDTYSIFDAPYYKVRAGDFEIRYDAEAFLKFAVEKGYTGAWIVRTKIKQNNAE